VEYESFPFAFDVNESLDVGFCIGHDSFSCNPAITNHLFEPAKSTFTEFETFALMDANLTKLLSLLKERNLWTYDQLFCLDSVFMMAKFPGQ